MLIAVLAFASNTKKLLGSIYKVSCYRSVLLLSFCTIICYSSVMSFGIARSGTCFSGSETHQLITFVES